MIKQISGGLAVIHFLLPALAVADTEIDARLASASADKGESIFRKCKACHTVEQDGKKRTGPNLWAIVGREVASFEGFKYSDALKAHGGVWSPERLDAFLKKPKAEVKGTKMAFVGLPKENDRADLIAYLNQNSPTPIAFGDTDETVAGEAEDAAPDIGILFLAEGGEETFDYCTACHSERIVAQQGQTRDGWEELLEWMVDEQGMSPIEEPDLSLVLDYLATNYGLDRPNFPNQ
ncbi:cytochrome c family protein [Aliiroseovarius sp. KMU-50]|uniref:Cytochrome c family protein n=1 Tax=Aliiroseovarius salicola TaxID=3009082 RepID=A0ABT4W761_9RHOB|nr:cytochrome c family protein [Aliiroseovarius sp. KMU-50]MDA5095808.1 cytochrome c family protein [Aliiroseovarius sp. KMU-50]